MEEFPYYGLSWFFYLIVTAAFLLLSSWKTRNWSIWTRIPVLSFLAAMALTPGVTVSGESWLAPAAILMIFEIDQKGLSGMWPNLISIISFWLVLMLGTVLARWILINKILPSTRPKEKQDDADEFPGQPELKDPEQET